jgi:hypothetical protein
VRISIGFPEECRLHAVATSTKLDDDPAMYVGAVEGNAPAFEPFDDVAPRIRVRRKAACVHDDDFRSHAIKKRVGATGFLRVLARYKNVAAEIEVALCQSLLDARPDFGLEEEANPVRLKYKDNGVVVCG